MSELNDQWEELLKALEIQGRFLDLAHELSVYIRWCDEILYWIKDKVFLLFVFVFLKSDARFENTRKYFMRNQLVFIYDFLS